ncbi:N-6 DNA methylase [Streptomyces europaeiscabiei]|uniref:HsdM family class I SAM-dependent methyltransferase n=1 Tax=Streptomyces europaeiscabiei TaxID=146819 RepID=UPI0029AF3C2E|nr:N-6 DNA methylase [Streptomyces europaeiscabiei]MDX3694981.1 N-6 DNA methylase [Streptomyces europaeiscabiei]
MTQAPHGPATPAPSTRTRPGPAAGPTYLPAQQSTAPHELGEDQVFDYIGGTAVVRLTEAESIRQQIARALAEQYGIDPRDMAADFPLQVANPEGGRPLRRRAGIAVFEHGRPHEQEYIRRVVVTATRPRKSRTAFKIRLHAQAGEHTSDVAQLMEAAGPACSYGMWTDGADLYFIGRSLCPDSQDVFQPLTNWPRADALTPGSFPAAAPGTMTSPANDSMLQLAVRRCRTFLHANEGHSKDVAYWQLLYVLFAKLHDERQAREGKGPTRFGPDNGRPAMVSPDPVEASNAAARLRDLFEDAKQGPASHGLLGQHDQLVLSDRALAFVIGELAAYDLHGTPPETLLSVYQELFGDPLRGDRGQYFTPPSVVRLLVEITDPSPDETVLDPCCGTGGFLHETLAHLARNQGPQRAYESSRLTGLSLRKYTETRLFGADLDSALTRAAGIGVTMLTGSRANTFHMDSLAFPSGTLPGAGAARSHLERIGPGTVDVLLTNPPFGTDIAVTGPILEPFRTGTSPTSVPSVAFSWGREKDGTLKRGTPASSVAPERLFVQRAIEWVRPGGRIGLVLPNGLLSNPGPDDEALRRYILDECWLMASVELPAETFLVGAGVNVLTSALVLRRKTERERHREQRRGPTDYPVFMAVAERIGYDRRGNPLYVREASGEHAQVEHEERDEISADGVTVPRRTLRHVLVPEDDLASPRGRRRGSDGQGVINAYRAFVDRYADEFPWTTREGA